MIFVFSALNYTCWYDLFLKNRKLQEIFGLQIYIYKDDARIIRWLKASIGFLNHLIVTAHSPTFPPLHLRHSSFYNPSVGSPT